MIRKHPKFGINLMKAKIEPSETIYSLNKIRFVSFYNIFNTKKKRRNHLKPHSKIFARIYTSGLVN